MPHPHFSSGHLSRRTPRASWSRLRPLASGPTGTPSRARGVTLNSQAPGASQAPNMAGKPKKRYDGSPSGTRGVRMLPVQSEDATSHPRRSSRIRWSPSPVGPQRCEKRSQSYSSWQKVSMVESSLFTSPEKSFAIYFLRFFA